MKSILRLLIAGVFAAALPASWAQAPAGKTEVLWLGQSAFRITTPGGKVIVTDPWLKLNPLTPPDCHPRASIEMRAVAYWYT